MRRFVVFGRVEFKPIVAFFSDLRQISSRPNYTENLSVQRFAAHRTCLVVFEPVFYALLVKRVGTDSNLSQFVSFCEIFSTYGASKVILCQHTVESETYL